MPHIPFLSRLHIREYAALVISFILIGLESIISIITLTLPPSIIKLFYRLTRRLFNYLSSPQGRRSRQKKKAISSSIANASDFVELCELFGYYAEEHIVQTRDGYLLGLHRLGWRRGEEGVRINAGGVGDGGLRKKVVYLHHGLMMNSEVWMCLTEKERNLPFVLVERGYDVWLGNNRGNKYSKKCVHSAPTSTAFWNFSMDQFAFHDIPDSISYILSTTSQPSLSYIGFSQGTAQAFATLSIHPTLNEQVDVFIALAPAMSPKGLTSTIVDSFVKASPEVLFLAFGRRAILGSATMWQAILYPPIFVRLIDVSLSFLFGWTGQNITPHQKLAAYPHLYSFTSTKSVVHWFQIIRNGVFQMYDDEAPLTITNRNKYYKIAKFPTRNIKTPIVLVYGGSDSLVDIDVMLKELPRHTVAKEIPHYEHLDFLWASSVNQLVFPHVFDALDEYATSDGEAGAGGSGSDSRSGNRKRVRRDYRSPARYRGPFLQPGNGASMLGLRDNEDEDEDESSSSPAILRAKKVSQNTGRLMLPMADPSSTTLPNSVTTTDQTDAPMTPVEGLARRDPQRGTASRLPASASTYPSQTGQGMHGTSPPPPHTALPPSALFSPSPNPPDAPSDGARAAEGKRAFRVGAFPTITAASPANSQSQHTNQTSTSRPEGWWSSDEVAGTGGSNNSTPAKSPSRASFESLGGGKDGRFGKEGIRVGAGRAVGGVVYGEGLHVGGFGGHVVGDRVGSGAKGDSGSRGNRGEGAEKKRRKGKRREGSAGGGAGAGEGTGGGSTIVAGPGG
ncbi:alpha/beta-hydrolase [Lepidopterella palustris CBS 459.81]|uniref:Alpha/beta-hydrolase n=1 Tax=Lepidopterella palustris CBS 459.81 TaxID=1314670 RepID=A0A8E2E1K4_9PEZI|nr:alpha/beta-hydrolase [Lepidopterella palustris CBS 459.81]